MGCRSRKAELIMPGQFARKNERQASRNYRCDVCSRIIKRGRSYTYIFGRQANKGVFIMRLCQVCEPSSRAISGYKRKKKIQENEGT